MSYNYNSTELLISQQLKATDNPTADVLHDIKPVRVHGQRAEEQPWRLRRAQAELLSNAYITIGNLSKAARVAACAGWLIFSPPSEEQRMKLQKAQFCRVRLCPMCQWRRSLKIYGQTTQIINAANASRKGGYAWIMLTLTQRNVPGESLSADLDRISRAWQRLQHRKEWQAAVKGWMKCIEITHNLKNNTYHPHIHALLMVMPSYFTGRTYITRARWAQLWQECAQLDYKPSVWITKSYGDKARQIAEVSKYASKPDDYIIVDDWELTADSIQTLDAACAKRRFLAYGGKLKEIKQQLALDDIESDSADLVHTGADDTPEISDEMAGILYQWVPGVKNYYRAK